MEYVISTLVAMLTGLVYLTVVHKFGTRRRGGRLWFLGSVYYSMPAWAMNGAIFGYMLRHYCR